MDDAKMKEVAGLIRYEDLHSIAIRIMKLQDAELSDIGTIRKQTTKYEKYLIIKLWADQIGAKEEDLHRIFHEARKKGIGVPQNAIDCLQDSASQGILNNFLVTT